MSPFYTQFAQSAIAQNIAQTQHIYLCSDSSLLCDCNMIAWLGDIWSSLSPPIDFPLHRARSNLPYWRSMTLLVQHTKPMYALPRPCFYACSLLIETAWLSKSITAIGWRHNKLKPWKSFDFTTTSGLLAWWIAELASNPIRLGNQQLVPDIGIH